MRALPIASGCTCPEAGVRMPNDASRPGFPREWSLPPSRRLLCGRFGKLCSSKFLWEWCWPMRLWTQSTQFRTSLTELGLHYIGGIETTTSVWEPGKQPLPAPPRKPVRGAMPTRLQRNAEHHPISVKQLALGLPSSAWKDIGWRPGTQGTLRSRFAAVRVRPAHRDEKRTEPRPEEWLLIEWPKEASEPTKYWLSNLPAATSLKPLVKLAKHRWVIERDYEELKQELGLGHYEDPAELARISSSRHFMYCFVWVPDGPGGTVPTPCCRQRQCWTISPEAAAGLPPARVAASARNDIIHTRSPRCGLTLPVNCSETIYLHCPLCGARRDGP